jgi:hypothetical protein
MEDNMTNEQYFAWYLENVFKQTQRKHDLYYKEGYGALIVPEGYPLEPHYVLATISEVQIRIATRRF